MERKRKAQRALDRKRRDLKAARDQMEYEAKVADDWLRFLVARGVVKGGLVTSSTSPNYVAPH